MTNKKMTKREMFNQIKANYNLTAEEITFINHELELLDKKNSTDRKPTATQIANEDVKSAILEGMEVGRPYTVSELIKEIPCCAELSNQKVSALMRQLVPDSVEKVTEKRKSYFRRIA